MTDNEMTTTRFDAVLATLMLLHHLPRVAREQCAREMRRVLKPGGRVLAVDFGRPYRQGGLMSRLHHHGVELRNIVELLGGAGLHVVESGPLGMRDLHYALAVKED